MLNLSKSRLCSLSDGKQADIIYSFNTAHGYSNDIININNIYIDNMLNVPCRAST